MNSIISGKAWQILYSHNPSTSGSSILVTIGNENEADSLSWVKGQKDLSVTNIQEIHRNIPLCFQNTTPLHSCNVLKCFS